MRVVFITIFLAFLVITSKINVFSNYYNYYAIEFYYLREINKMLPIFRTADEWSLDVALDYRKSENIDEVLDNLDIDSAHSSRMIVYKIGKYVASQLDGHRGSKPRIDAYAYRPDILLKKIQNGETEVYCTHYTRIFAQLALQAGLPVRIIHTRRLSEAYNHTLAEVFLVDENQWAVVDLQNKYALLVDKITHQPLNLFELITSVRNKKSFDVVSSSANYLYYEPNIYFNRYSEYYGDKNSLLYISGTFLFERRMTRNWWKQCGIYCRLAQY